jgi:hypothetical protein
MNQIELSKGLIALGGNKGIGKTRFSLKLANFLAKHEKVLYISYQDYSEKLHSIINEIDIDVNENLEINTSFGYFNVGTFLKMMNYVKEKVITTLFIDDLDCFNRNEFHEFNEIEKDSAIEGLLFISKQLNIRVIFNLVLTKNYHSYNFVRPQIRDFDWSRKIVNDCSQIFALYRPVFYGMTEDEDGFSLLDVIEILNLKNQTHKELIYKLDNKQLNIYNRTF